MHKIVVELCISRYHTKYSYMLRSASDQHQGIKSNQSSTAYNKIKCFYEQFIQYKSLKCI